MNLKWLTSNPLIESAWQVFFRAKHEDCRINARDEYGRTALAWAAHEGHEDTVRALVKIPTVDLDARDRDGRTPVSLAAKRCHITIVKILLDRGAHPNFKDFSGATALWYAAKEGTTAMANLLLRHGADVNVAAIQSDVGLHTPLSFAAMHGHNEIARLLLVQPGIQSHAKVRPWDMHREYTSLELAVKGKHYRVVDTFLSHACVSDECEPLLRLAAEHGDENVVQLLLGMDIEVKTRSDHGDTPLHCAVKGGNNGVVALLLSRPGVLLNIQNEDGDTPALLAARRGRFQALQLLLVKGADVGARNHKGRTPLSEAAEMGYLSVVQLLLATNGVDADPQDHQGRTPLSLAISPATHVYDPDAMDRCGVVRCLLDSGRVDVNSRDMKGKTPLSFATQSPVETPLVGMLLEHERLDVNIMDEDGRTPLTWAVYWRQKNTTKLLLNKGADPNLGKFNNGESLLSYAAKQGSLKIANTLLCFGGVDPSQKDHDGHTPLCHAAENGHVKILDMLLTAGGLDVNAQCDHGQTPLHHAASGYNNNKRVVIAFLLAIDNIAADTRDEKGKIPLHYAVRREDETVVSLLLGAQNVGLNYKDGKGRTPLSRAASAGCLSIVERCLEFDDDILNAILGIMQFFAERKPPIYHLCGIPLVQEKSIDKDDRRIPTLLEAFATGLCWRHLLIPGTRREGFPSWSWTGWKGRAYGITHSSVTFEHGHSIDVSMVSRNEPSHIVSWADLEAMNAEEKASLPGDYRLRITATTVEVNIYKSYRWGVVLYNGDDAFSGELNLCKDPEQDAGFGRRLVEERWLAIVVGDLSNYEGSLLLLVDKVKNQCKGEDHWERVGVIKTEQRHGLDVSAGGCTKRTLLID